MGGGGCGWPDLGGHGRPAGAVGGRGRPDPAGGLGALARPHNAQDSRSGDQRRPDVLVELARRTLEGGQLPQTGGVRPQLLVTVDLESLLGRPGALGGEAGWVGPLAPEACRRLACDGALTRALITRQPGGQRPGDDCGGQGGVADRLQAAMVLLSPPLGGAPSQPLDVGRASRVITPPNAAPWPRGTGLCVSRL
jgi:Domain of unknown function (DUF222)